MCICTNIRQIHHLHGFILYSIFTTSSTYSSVSKADMHLYLSTSSPWNSTYSDDKGKLLYKVECTWRIGSRNAAIYRALPDLSLPTSERQLWEERHYLETHPSWSDHPELEGQGSGSPVDDLILEERRTSYDSNHELTFSSSGTGNQSPAHSNHEDDHPFFVEKHWAHFADVEFHTIHSTILRIAGEENKASEMFQKEGWSWFGRNRAFNAPDGTRYRWELDQRCARLYRVPSGSQSPPPLRNSVEALVAEFIPAKWDARRRRRTPPSLEILPTAEHLADRILVTLIYVEKLRSERETDHPQGGRPSYAARSGAAV
ncbi:hypothetical protein FA15DRAFT_669405 [Coprinopsis marcescibilis]|uniref:DUF6593 domain-containing protein n=1 Tax=Coprinopsis marcescibilis TaxID=230819 RepID=A0A5C3KW60_COPMA|nr:hypothetical protein FA15DRAFT_669405 [Coprinopsis marcescibilis]